MRITADRDRCVGAGLCATTVPEVFDQDADDGRVLLLMEQPPDDLTDVVREAVDACPSGALSIRE
jgi:ferredoxin